MNLFLRPNMILWANDEAGGGGGGGGEAVPEYAQAFPEDVQGWEEVKTAKDADAFWQQIGSHRKHLGNSIRIPSEEASAEDVSAFHQKLIDKVPGVIVRPDPENEEQMKAFHQMMGVPTDGEGYEMPEIDGKGIDVDMTAAEAFRGIAAKYKLTPAQFAGIISEVSAANIDRDVALKNEIQEDMKSLRTDWGAAFDTRMKVIRNLAVATKAPEELLNAIDNETLGSASALWLYDIASKFKGEGVNLNTDKNAANANMTPAEAAMRISEIRNNKEHPYWNASDPAHKQAKEEMRRLYKIKAGEAA